MVAQRVSDALRHGAARPGYGAHAAYAPCVRAQSSEGGGAAWQVRRVAGSYGEPRVVPGSPARDEWRQIRTEYRNGRQSAAESETARRGMVRRAIAIPENILCMLLRPRVLSRSTLYECLALPGGAAHTCRKSD